MNSNEKEPMHIIIDGFGGFHCKNNQEVLLDRIDTLEKIIESNINKLEFLERELDNLSSDVPFDKKFKTVLTTIKYDSILDPRDYYPIINKEGER